MKQGREASSTSEVPSLFPRLSPASTAERRWLRQHSFAVRTQGGLLPSTTMQENEQDNSPPHRLQASRPALRLLSSLHHEEWSPSAQAAERDCSELPSPPLKHAGYRSHSFLSPWCYRPAHLRVTRALFGLQVEILRKRQHRREKAIHETEDTWERKIC